MTISGYDVVMKQVRIAELKARLSEYLRAVRRGHTVTVLDRDTPIAEIAPIRQRRLKSQKPLPGTPKFNEIPLLPPLKLNVDLMKILDEVRADRIGVDTMPPSRRKPSRPSQ